MKPLFALLLWLPLLSAAQSLYFPPLSGNQWESVTPASLGWCQPPLDSLIAYTGSQNSKALLILKDGKMVLEQYYGTFTRDSAWYWASAGKTLTSMLTGIAQQEGYLSLNDPSSTYLGTGWTAEPAAKEALVTIRHQLTMTTGLDDGVADNHCTLDTCLVYKADAGTRWAYHNGPYTMLDGVIAGATGTPFSAYFNSKIRNKTGMTGLWFKSNYDNVYYSTPRSMARFGLLILSKGIWNGDTILKDTAYFRQMTNTSQPLNLSYGYLWWLNGKASVMVPTLPFVFPGPLAPNAPSDMIAALGKNGQIINVVPSLGLVMVRMGSQGTNGAEVSFELNDGMWAWLSQALCTTAAAPEASPSRLRLTPNPAGDMLMVTGPALPASAFVTDISGRKVLNINLLEDGIPVSVSALAQGLYWLHAGGTVLAFARQ